MAKNESAPFYWVIILIAAVVGIATVFMSWMEVTSTIGGIEIWASSYDAFEFATGDTFKEGGLFETFNEPGKYIPAIIGVLALLEIFLAIRARTKPGAAVVVGLMILFLAVYFYTFVDPISNGSGLYDRQVGIAVWISMAVGLISVIGAGIQAGAR